MLGYAEEEVFTLRDRLLLGVAVMAVLKMTGKIDDEWVRCHELARAVATILGSGKYRVYEPSLYVIESASTRGDEFIVVDGHYGHVEHSWIVTSRKILDVYVPGRLPQVQLIDPYCLLKQAGYEVQHVPG